VFQQEVSFIPEHYAAEGNVENCADYSEERADAVWYISFFQRIYI